MQDLNWDNLRLLLALSRARSYAAAGRALGLDETTVARRIRALANAVGAPLTTRQGLTELGERLVLRAEEMEAAALAIPEDQGEIAARVSGRVALTATPVVMNGLLIPALPAFLDAHSGLELTLIPEARSLDLNMREADLALRLARPSSGGQTVAARRIATLEMALFACPGHDPNGPWIGYHGPLPQTEWMTGAGLTARLRLSDAGAALEAAAEGLGIALLPRFSGQRDARLRELSRPDLPPMPTREVWLLSHRSQHNYARIRAVIRWIESVFSP